MQKFFALAVMLAVTTSFVGCGAKVEEKKAPAPAPVVDTKEGTDVKPVEPAPMEEKTVDPAPVEEKAPE